jgi:hypothetical protein
MTANTGLVFCIIHAYHDTNSPAKVAACLCVRVHAEANPMHALEITSLVIDPSFVSHKDVVEIEPLTTWLLLPDKRACMHLTRAYPTHVL